MSKDKDKEDTTSKLDDFDDVLESVGSLGRYQKLLLYLVLCPIITVQPLFTMNGIFMLFEPDHWCHVPGKDDEVDIEYWKNLTIPREPSADKPNAFSQCNMYDKNGSIVSCQNGWDYDKTDYDLTIPSQYDWVCSADHYATDSLTAYAVGNCIGSLIFGWCADKYGRKPVCFFAIFINTFFRGVSLYVPHNFLWFLITQFVVGTAFPTMYILPCILVSELSSKDYRGWIYAVGWMIWVVGMSSLPILAYFVRNWFIIGLVTSVPGVLLFVYYWFLPESPRWLLQMGKVDEALKVLERIAAVNGTTDKISKADLEGKLNKLVLQTNKNGMNKRTGAWTLFSRPRLGRNTILLTICWSLNALIYYGVTLNSSRMSGNQFLNFFILAVIELPSGYLGGVLVERTGRRWTQVAFFLIGGFAFVAAGVGVMSHGLEGLVIAAVVVAKFCVTLTFFVVYLQGTEIFPTELRSTGTGFASTVASAVGITGPYLIFLGKFSAVAPYAVLASLSAIGLVCASFLPETLKQGLPETLDDANALGKGVKFWSHLPKSNSKSASPEPTVETVEKT